MRRFVFTAPSFVLLACAWAVACDARTSGGDEEGGPGGRIETNGTCDYRHLEGYTPTCIEYDAEPQRITNLGETCIENGGYWSNDRCPAVDLFGCCTRTDTTSDISFHECNYAPTLDRQTMETLCENETFCTGPYQGVWTPGPAYNCTPPPPTGECVQFCGWLATVCPDDITDVSACSSACVPYYYADECPEAFGALARCMQQVPASSLICNGIDPHLGDPDPCMLEAYDLIQCQN